MDILFLDKRPMFLMGAAAVAGAYIATGENVLMAVILAVIILAGALIGKTGLRYIAAAIFVVFIFVFSGLITANSYDDAYSEFIGKQCEISGVISSVESVKEEYTLVIVKPKGFMKKKIKVYIIGCSFELIQGDRIVFSGKLYKPEPATNPGGYDGRKILYGDRIASYSYTDNDDVYLPGGFTFGRIFGLIRKDIRDKCRLLLGNDRGGILAGMLIGDKAMLDSCVKKEFRDSGLSHTMAVSGAHIAYILAPLMFLFTKIGTARRNYYPILLILLLFFAALTGFQPSVCRASLTAGLMLLSGIISRETDALNNIGTSAFILVTLNPFTIFDAGFILSYVCVVSILILYKPLVGLLGGNPVSRLAALTLAVQAGVLPATAKLFYSVQVFSFIANLLIFPVRAVLAIAGWVMYFISTVSVSIAGVIAVPVSALTDSVSSVAALFGSSVLSSVNVPYIPPWAVVLYLVMVYTVLHIKKHRTMFAATVIAVVLSGMMLFHRPCNTYVFYDSGQADCFLVKTNSNRDILIDTGEYALGSPIAYYSGDFIDCIFLTHSHDDHIGGLEGILERFRVGVVFIPGCGGCEMEDVIRLCKQNDVPVKTLIAGDRLFMDEYEILVLNPFDKDYLSLNDTSLVLKLIYGDKSLLYTGDIEIPAEIDVLSSGFNMDSDLFKVPHHGAAGSAYAGFFDEVSPEIAVVSCGRNSFGHPSREVFGLLNGIPVYSTDRHGAVVIKGLKNGYRIKLCRTRTTVD